MREKIGRTVCPGLSSLCPPSCETRAEGKLGAGWEETVLILEGMGRGWALPVGCPLHQEQRKKKKKAGAPFTAAAPSLHSRFEDVRARISPLFLFQGVAGSRSCFSTKKFLKKPKKLV